MGNFLNAPGFAHLFPALAAALVLAGCIAAYLRGRNVKLRRNTEVFWISSLHFFSKELSECNDPQQMVDQSLRGALEMLDTQEGYLLVHEEGDEGKVHSCLRGISLQGAERLSRDPLRRFVLSSGERWGALMVFPDLRRSEVVAAWQRDPVFHEFRDVLRGEGLRTLIVVGLQVREKSYGSLVLGFRRVRSFGQQELRVALAIGNQVSVAIENWSLNRAAERREEELRILHRIGEALRATFDINAQIEIFRRELKGVLGGTNFGLALQDTAEGPLEVVVPFESAGPQSTVAGGPASSLAQFVQRTRQPLLVASDVQGTTRQLGLAPMNPLIKTWCGVPLHFSDGSIGVLALADMEREYAVTKCQFDLVRVLAQEGAVALENARLFKKEQRRAIHLGLLNELGRKANSVLNPQELLPSICRQVRHAFGYDLARIELLDQGRTELVVEAEAGYGPELMGRRIRLGEGLAGAAAEAGEPILANSVVKEPRYIALNPGIRSALSLPLKYREELMGVLSLESRKAYAFSQQDVLTLHTLADQLAIALHNARAYQVALEQAITDGLTGLKTHRYFMEALDREWRRSTRSGNMFSLIMMDLDGFKQVNDLHGHLEGDKVLTAVANLLNDRVRQSNVVARYGGDEFAIMMPETRTEQAEILAERLRASIESDGYLAAHGVTASFGISTFPVHGPTQEEILRVADSGMYLAKHQEGNRVRVASLHIESAQADWDRQLLEARLGVTMKRMFSTGPEAFNHYLERFQDVMLKGNGDAPSLMDTVTALAFAIDAKDHYTQGHSQDVSRLAVQIARQMGMPDAEIEEVRLGGILHDIGKIGVPESVLNKTTRLTPEEFDLMKSHTVLGAKILEPLKVKAIDHIRGMVRYHHEMVDGTGYPDHLKGENIPLGARIITVADCFDAMVSDRAYKRGRTIDQAMEELLRCCGTQFDPDVVKALVQSQVALNDFPPSLDEPGAHNRMIRRSVDRVSKRQT
ncbi:MAG: diguanylate cyclase [Terriglobia bacterium]|jgi:diguanylate cyclase (GGDEF)-like protein/putative nucleotidyltransferase with HDIG domain